MEPLHCSTTPLLPEEPSPKSSPQAPPSPPRSSPPPDPEKSASPVNEPPPSPEPNCAICLAKPHNKSFTDSCLHQFCFTCLLEWSRVKPECPLCKQSFKSIIHNVRSNEDYDQYHLREADPPRLQNTLADQQEQRFRYPTTLTAERRLERALQDLEHDLQRRFEPGDIIPPHRPCRPGMQRIEFRIHIYVRNYWITRMRTPFGMRPITPAYFRNNPGFVNRVMPWLNRELQAILRDAGTSARVLDIILSRMTISHMDSNRFRNLVEPYLRNYYNHFIHEFRFFARSSYDMNGFDENAVYDIPNDSMVEVVQEVSDSSDSDVIVLPQDESRNLTRHITTSTSPIPGILRPPPAPITQPSESDWSSSDSSRSDTEGSIQDAEMQVVEDDPEDCVIVGYVKPRHERTPEIITLVSDTEVEEVVAGVPQVNEIIEDSSSTTSTSSSDDSDSEYVPTSLRRSIKKVVQQKKKSPSTSTKKKSDQQASSSHTKRRDFCQSDSDGSKCSCPVRNPRRKPHSISSSSSSCSSSSACADSHHRKRGSWHVKINMPESRHDRSHDPPSKTSEINLYLPTSSSSNSSASRPKLRSIVIARQPTAKNKVKGTSNGDHNKCNKVKVKSDPSAVPSTSRHRGCSHSSHSSRHRESSSSSGRHRHIKKEYKRKHRKESYDLKTDLPKIKKRKRILSIYSDSSDD